MEKKAPPPNEIVKIAKQAAEHKRNWDKQQQKEGSNRGVRVDAAD